MPVKSPVMYITRSYCDKYMHIGKFQGTTKSIYSLEDEARKKQ